MILYASMVLTAGAAELDFTYNTADGVSGWTGFDKEETYDMAIKINQPSLDGFKVKGLRVKLPETESIGNASAWISTDLKLKQINGKYVNTPDVTQKEGNIDSGWLEVEFEDIYTLTGPVYVGYSFTVNELNEASSQPVSVTEGTNPDGLYIHTSRTKMKWGEYVSQSGSVSTLTVLAEGELHDNAAVMQASGNLTAAADEDVRVVVNIENHGLNAIETIDYTYTCEAYEGKGTIVLDEPLKAVWGASAPVELDLGQIDLTGRYTLTLTVTDVNGQPNNDTAPSTEQDIMMYPFIPVNRPLVEEYTGLWCGWCPQGYVAMETMSERYGDRFVGLVYHSGDDMQCNFKFPTSPNGFPAAYINRGQDIDATDIYTMWPKISEEFTPASIDIAAEWTDDTKQAIKATATVKFIESIERAGYAIAYALVEDGLSNPKWLQTNYYAPAEGEEPKDSPDMPGELGKLFTHGTNPVAGLIYNDVVIALPKAEGFPGSIPSDILAGEEITHSYTFNLNDVTDRNGSHDIIQDPGMLRVVGIIMDTRTGHAVNSNSSLSMSESAGTDGINPIEEVVPVSTVCYDLQGHRVSDSYKGLILKVEIFSNGSVRTKKIIK